MCLLTVYLSISFIYLQEARWGIVGGSIVRVQRGPANTAEMSILRPDIDSIDQYDFILSKIKYNN